MEEQGRKEKEGGMKMEKVEERKEEEGGGKRIKEKKDSK
jgi:hypothetical protein